MYSTLQITRGWRHHDAKTNTVGETFLHARCSLNSMPFFFLSGEVMYVSALGQGILVINSQRVAVDLLEKRSNIYSDRPKYISAGEILTRHLELPMTPYGSL